MSYLSIHSGTEIDAGITINTTLNNRLTALENKDNTFATQLNNLSSTITSLSSIVNTLVDNVEANT